MTPRFLRNEDFSTYSVLLGPDGKLAGIEKQPETMETPRRPIPTDLDETLEDQAPEPVADAAAPEEAVLEDEITDAEAKKIVEGYTASSPNRQDIPVDVAPAASEAPRFEPEMTDAEAEKIAEESAAASPKLQVSAEADRTASSPIQDAETPPDEAFLNAKLDFADPLTFKVCHYLSAKRPMYTLTLTSRSSKPSNNYPHSASQTPSSTRSSSPALIALPNHRLRS